jgi:putative ABC transport system permease protein
MIKNYFKTAWRNILRNKTISFINLFGLSVGMTAAVLILIWVQNERSFDNYHPDAKNIFHVVTQNKFTQGEEWVWESSPLPMAEAAQVDIPDVVLTARMAPYSDNQVIEINRKLFREKGIAYVDNNWFTMFHYNLKQGSFSSFIKDPYGVVLTESTARKFFGNQEAIGQIIRNDSTDFTVRAIVKDNPVNSSFQFEILMPLSKFVSYQKKIGNNVGWGNFNYVTFLKLEGTADVNAVEKKLNELIRSNKGSNSKITATLEKLADMHFDTSASYSAFSHTKKEKTDVFSILALLLLLTASINYINLTTAKASLRSKEVSIRKIIGAKSMHLFLQFIVESVLISLLSLFFSIILIQLSLPFFNLLTGTNFVSFFSSYMVWKILLATLFALIIINGIYPALLLSSFKPLNVFRGNSLLKLKDTSIRKGLVVFQFTVSVILIIGTLVVFKQLQFIQTTNPGYNRDQIVSMQIPFKTIISMGEEQRAGFINAMKNELSANVNTQLVTSSNQPIVDVNNQMTGGAKWEGKDSLFNPSITTFAVDANYQKVFELQMKEGRWYWPNDKLDTRNYILNETAVKVMKLHQPIIGQRFSFNNIEGTIIGVVKDFHHSTLHSIIQPVLMHDDQSWQTYISVKARAGNIKQTLAKMETVWHKFLPNEPFEYEFMDDTFNALYDQDMKTSKLILGFSLIAIIISALGLFGLTAFTVERQRKEIGIRKVLGATVSDITSKLSKEFIILVSIAFLIASPIAWWVMNKWLEDFAYRININWSVFVFAGLAVLLIALVTVSFQAVRAAVANPVKSLRTE